MTHPLFQLIGRQSEATTEPPEPPRGTSGTSMTDLPSVAAGTQQAKRGEAEGGEGGGVAAGGVGPAEVPAEVAALIAQPGYGWPVPTSRQPGLAILAIQDPPGEPQPGAVNQPGRTAFAPGLTLAERKEILFDIEWFDVRVRRREVGRLKELVSEDE